LAIPGAPFSKTDMPIQPLEFGGVQFWVAGDAALFWPARRALIVADLHLEKASSYATRGQMLPPYDSQMTLEMVAALAQRFDALAIICLGDNFHDDAGEKRLQGKAADLLRAMTLLYDWTWITGNHDPHVAAHWGGSVAVERLVDGIMLRHEAEPSWTGPEISGHFHPKLRMTVRRRNVARRVFVMNDQKIIMPAFGALTGGLDAGHDVILRAMGWVKGGNAVYALVPTRMGFSRFALRAG
jgi:uncharacterized protein